MTSADRSEETAAYRLAARRLKAMADDWRIDPIARNLRMAAIYLNSMAGLIDRGDSSVCFSTDRLPDDEQEIRTEPRVLQAHQLAEALRCAGAWVREQADAGETLPYATIGGAAAFLESGASREARRC